MHEICPMSDCFGCFACLNICPKNAITAVEIKGFLYPKIDESLCVNCGLCKKKCPALNEVEKKTPVNNVAIAAVHQDKTTRDSSSSGGIFYALAKDVISCGGVVYGAVWTDSFVVEHVRIDDFASINKMQGSKYVQSYIGNVYSLVKADLISGKKVLFTGVPCQVAGLTSYLGKTYENLVRCEVLCHGSASPVVLKDHLRYIEHLFGSQVNGVNFRKKNSTKCQNICYSFESRADVFIDDPMSDYFYSGFQNGYNVRENCFSCQFIGEGRCADITLGDFWGLKNYNSLKKDDLTYPSLILVNTPHGAAAFDRIKESLYLEERTFEEARLGNLCFRRHLPLSKWRKKFFEEYEINGYSNKARLLLLSHENFKTIVKKIVGKRLTSLLIRLFRR